MSGDKTSRRVRVLTAGFIAAGLVAVVNAPDSRATSIPRRQSVTIAQPGWAPSFLPWTGPNGRLRYSYPLYDSLGTFDPVAWKKSPGTWKVEKQLAVSWEWAKDGRSMRVRMRSNVMFHDNRGEVTAEDVVYTLEKTRDSTRSSRGSAWRSAGVRARAIGRYEVEITAEKPIIDPNFALREILELQGAIASKGYVTAVGEDEADRRPVGTGPFRWKRTEANMHVYERVPGHWRIDPPFDELRIMRVTEPSARSALLRSGQVQVTSDPTGEEIRLARAAGLKVVSIPDLAYQVIGFGGLALDSRDPRYGRDRQGVDPWADVRVRRAMALAVNAQAIIDTILARQGKVTGALGLWPSALRLKPYGFNPDEAKRLLKEAGYPNGFAFEMSTVDIPGAASPREIAEALAVMWENVGLKVKLRVEDWTKWFSTYARNDTTTKGVLWLSADEVRASSPIYFGHFLPQPESTNPAMVLYNDPKLTDMIHDAQEKALKAPEQYPEVEEKIVRYLYDNVVAIPLFTGPVVYLTQPGIFWEAGPFHNRRYDYIKLR